MPVLAVVCKRAQLLSGRVGRTLKVTLLNFCACERLLSVSVEIVASRDDFSERGSATRSTQESQHGWNCLAAVVVNGCCGSQTRAPLVAASPRCAVSPICNLPSVACEQRSADYKSAIRQIKNLRYAKQILHAMEERAGERRCVFSSRPSP